MEISLDPRLYCGYPPIPNLLDEVGRLGSHALKILGHARNEEDKKQPQKAQQDNIESYQPDEAWQGPSTDLKPAEASQDGAQDISNQERQDKGQDDVAKKNNDNEDKCQKAPEPRRVTKPAPEGLSPKTMGRRIRRVHVLFPIGRRSVGRQSRTVRLGS